MRLVRKEAACSLGDLGRVELGVAIGRVQGLPSPVRLLVHRPAGSDERGDVRDGVPHPVPLLPALDV